MMRLNPKQRNLLQLLELNAGLETVELARRLKMKPAMVLYYKRRFEESGLISYRQPIIDMNGLGITHYTIYLTFRVNAQNIIDRFINYLLSKDRVTWVFELSGEYQLAFTVSIVRPFELTLLMKDLHNTFPGIIFDKTICTQTAFTYFGRRYLGDITTANNSYPNFQIKASEVVADELDYRILAAMANRNDCSGSAISKLLKEPTATINRRINEMEKRGVIKGYFHWINASELGRISYILRIKVRGLAQELETLINKLVKTVPEIIFTLQCIGAWDFELGVEVANDSSLIPIIRKLHHECQDFIYPITSVTILKYHKFRSFPLMMTM